MSTASSKQKKSASVNEVTPAGNAAVINSNVPWNPWWGTVFAITVVFFGSQFIASLIVSIYPVAKHWNSSQATTWMSNSTFAQFFYVLFAETLTVGLIYLFVRHYKSSLRRIGFKRPKLVDPLYGLSALPVYLFFYFIAVGIVTYLVPSFNVNQQQDVGFTNVQGTFELILTFISLVVLPPIAEEIMVRGFIYSSLKKAMKVIPAAIVTSLLFAAAHLPEGGAAGPLYIAAIDTFILSLVLIYLREKTKSLWASITLHALKNGIAFVTLFLIHSR